MLVISQTAGFSSKSSDHYNGPTPPQPPKLHCAAAEFFRTATCIAFRASSCANGRCCLVAVAVIAVIVASVVHCIAGRMYIATMMRTSAWLHAKAMATTGEHVDAGRRRSTVAYESGHLLVLITRASSGCGSTTIRRSQNVSSFYKRSHKRWEQRGCCEL